MAAVSVGGFGCAAVSNRARETYFPRLGPLCVFCVQRSPVELLESVKASEAWSRG